MCCYHPTHTQPRSPSCGAGCSCCDDDWLERPVEYVRARAKVDMSMLEPTSVEHFAVDADAERRHCYNQVNVRRLRSGELVAVYNEERFPFHHDSGQTVLVRSRDDGATWGDRQVVLPFTDVTGNWDCGIAELDD